jgi:uncharacterized membrane protein YfcA
MRQSPAIAPPARQNNNDVLIEPQLILELALLGVAAGFLAGLLGIGGGMMMVPFMTIILTTTGYPA